MFFTLLVDDVFRQGCGTTLQAALQTNTYRHIYQNLKVSLTAERDDVALVELLGASLANRAFRNIPWRLRQRRAEWQQGVKAQQNLLSDICTELNTWKWRETGVRTYDYNSDNRCVLPNVTGSWQHGKVQPNCLGIAQMMVGFARAVGARHYLANVVQSNQETLQQYRMLALDRVFRMLELFPGFEAHAEQVRQGYWRESEAADKPQQAHHVLIIELADQSWWVVDPYLCALYPLENKDAWTQATDWVKEHHDRVAHLRQATPVNRYLDRINMHMQTLQVMGAMITGRFSGLGGVEAIDQPIPRMLACTASYVLVSPDTIDDPEEFYRQLAGLEARLFDGSRTMRDLEAMIVTVLGLAAWNVDTAEEANDIISSGKVSMDDFEAAMDRIAHDRAYEHELSMRIFRLALKDFMKYLEQLYSEPDARQHEILEICWPTMGIGIATLNHVQTGIAADVVDPAGLQGKLASLFSGQWVLHDALALDRRGGRLNPDYLPALSSTLQKLRAVPEMTIVPLRLLATKHKGA